MADNNKDLSYEQLIALEEIELTKTIQGIIKEKTLKKKIIDECFSNLLQNNNFYKNCILLTESITSCKHEKGSFEKKDFDKLFKSLKTNIEENKKKEENINIINENKINIEKKNEYKEINKINNYNENEDEEKEDVENLNEDDYAILQHRHLYEQLKKEYDAKGLKFDMEDYMELLQYAAEQEEEGEDEDIQ